MGPVTSLNTSLLLLLILLMPDFLEAVDDHTFFLFSKSRTAGAPLSPLLRHLKETCYIEAS